MKLFKNTVVSDPYSETLVAIKESIRALNGGDLFEPVYFNKMKISSDSLHWEGRTSMKLNVVFCDEKGILRGDLISSSKTGAGTVFGHNLEGIEMKDLIGILKSIQNKQ